jgi:transcriptional regulator with XRE-family HTH domain
MRLNNIKLEMTRADMTQGELARKVGTSRATVCNWANNSAQPSIEKLYKIADAIGVPAPRLLKDVNPLAQTETNGKA